MNTDTPALLQVTLKLAADYYWNELSWNELENCHLEPKVISKVNERQSKLIWTYTRVMWILSLYCIKIRFKVELFVVLWVATTLWLQPRKSLSNLWAKWIVLKSGFSIPRYNSFCWVISERLVVAGCSDVVLEPVFSDLSLVFLHRQVPLSSKMVVKKMFKCHEQRMKAENEWHAWNVKKGCFTPFVIWTTRSIYQAQEFYHNLTWFGGGRARSPIANTDYGYGVMRASDMWSLTSVGYYL